MFGTTLRLYQHVALRRHFVSTVAVVVLLLVVYPNIYNLYIQYDRSNSKYGSALPLHSARENQIHLALIFNHDYAKFAKQVVNSHSYYNTANLNRTVFHMITDSDGAKEIRKAFFNTTGVKFKFYDIHKISNKSKSLLSAEVLSYFQERKFTDMDTIQVTLHEHIFQEKVLYLDVDTTIVDDITPCYEHDMGDKLIGLSVDMGTICQEQPARCWPLSSLWRIPEELRCDAGILPESICKTQRYQSFMYNFGVSLMNLQEMRLQNFTSLFNQATEFIGKFVGRAAEWGAQEMINSMPIYGPHVIETLDCGCNYQFFGGSRFSLCPSQQIRIAHAWSQNLNSKFKNNTFLRHLYHFMGSDDEFNPAESQTISEYLFHDQRVPQAIDDICCSTQPYNCCQLSTGRHS